jgi:hypothetical protein
LQTSESVIEWLLDPKEPSIRFLASRDLLAPKPSGPALHRLQKSIGDSGWAFEILARQHEKTWWATKETCYRPKFRSTIWQLQVLADLGLTKEDVRIANAVEFWFELHYAKDGGYSPGVKPKRSHLCTTGNMVRSLIRMGYLDDERVQSAVDWLVDQQLPDGGWDCFGRPNGTLDAWEAMSAFAEIPENRRTIEVRKAIEHGAEFFLRRWLLHEGAPSRRWLLFCYPWHYFYDALVGLDFMTRLGYGHDRRIEEALSAAISKRRPDGKWLLDGVPGTRSSKLQLETAKKPSKMITFLALRVLRRVNVPHSH